MGFRIGCWTIGIILAGYVIAGAHARKFTEV